MPSPENEPDIGAKPGDVLAGKYRVERVLGKGGMGIVVEAHHLQLDERVALKFLLPEGLKDAEAIARFDREARAAVKIKSEHVARVTDVGRLETGAPYMVMEYLEGEDLSVWLRKRGPMPVEQACEFLLQACEAIAEAHALGIVHRDLKPANLFCIRRADGMLSLKVLDFGISKMTANLAGSRPDLGMTKTSAVVGSPVYMSPEQMQSSKGVDARTDIWSLGIILFELVTGELPFDGASVTELAIKIATAPPVRIASLRPDLPPGFDYVVSRCLEKDREARFQNVAELAIALKDYGPRRSGPSVERVLRTLQVSGVSLPLPPSGAFKSALAETMSAPGAGPTPDGPTATGSAWGGTRAGKRPRRAAVAAILVGAVALVAAAGALVVKTRRPPSAPSSLSAATPLPAIAASMPPPAALVVPSASSSSSSTPPDPPKVSATPVSSARAPSRWVAAPPAAAPQPAPSPATAPSAPAHPACTPPYFVDSAGRRRYKPECL